MLENLRGKPLLPTDQLETKPPCRYEQSFRDLFVSEASELPFSHETNIHNMRMDFGHFCACVQSKVNGSNLAVKVHLPPALPSDTPPEDQLRQLQGEVDFNRKEYERLRKDPLIAPFIPQASFLIGHGINGRPSEVDLQPWIDGQKVGEINLGDILKNPHLLFCLQALIDPSIAP